MGKFCNVKVWRKLKVELREKAKYDTRKAKIKL